MERAAKKSDEKSAILKRSPGVYLLICPIVAPAREASDEEKFSRKTTNNTSNIFFFLWMRKKKPSTVWQLNLSCLFWLKEGANMSNPSDDGTFFLFIVYMES